MATVVLEAMGTDGAPSQESSFLQHSDERLKPQIQHIEEGILPCDERLSKKLILEQSHYMYICNGGQSVVFCGS